MDTMLIAQCALGLTLGLALHILKKAKEQEKISGQKISVVSYVRQDPKETAISAIIGVILTAGFPELTELASGLASDTLGMKLPALERGFFLSALFGGFGNSLTDLAGTYFFGPTSRLAKAMAPK